MEVDRRDGMGRGRSPGNGDILTISQMFLENEKKNLPSMEIWSPQRFQSFPLAPPANKMLGSHPLKTPPRGRLNVSNWARLLWPGAVPGTRDSEMIKTQWSPPRRSLLNRGHRLLLLHPVCQVLHADTDGVQGSREEGMLHSACQNEKRFLEEMP